MGCATSKQSVTVTPAEDISGNIIVAASARIGSARRSSGRVQVEKKKKSSRFKGESELGQSGSVISQGEPVSDSVSFRLGHVHKYAEQEQVAAGWPAWLSAVAGDAIKGWVPRRAESFEKLEKIGQGTYSTVFRARDLDTGQIVALKKVRFDNFEPESVRFMAREITILRGLDHPNIIKLQGLIASRLSCSLYLIFEYMEHDLTGLLACPDIQFSVSQIKCYMKQLLSAVDHCHSMGIMHRDIKGSNILISNEGILKVSDFGLANFCNYKQPLTSRVVTLWYRPPELLLGATNYGASVDLWSIGCVFAEILLGKPLLQGRTEVEQLHKIFKLCGSPSDDYWKKSKLPHSTLFKPQQSYESCLWDTCKGLPVDAVNLIKTFLSIEPHKRQTASSALASEYFNTEPLACEPSTLPVYPPNKEIDVKSHEEASKKKTRARRHEEKKTIRKTSGIAKLAHSEAVKSQSAQKIEWAKRHIDEDGVLLRSNSQSGSRSLLDRLNDSNSICARDYSDSKKLENACFSNYQHQDSDGIDQSVMIKQWGQCYHPESLSGYDECHSQELTFAPYQRQGMASWRSKLASEEQGEQIEFSGPILTQTRGVDELLKKHERQIRKAIRRSWLQKGRKPWK